MCTEEARVPLGTKRAYMKQFKNSSSTEIGLEVSEDLTLKKRLENLNFPRFPEPYDRAFTAQPHIGDNLVFLPHKTLYNWHWYVLLALPCLWHIDT